ncbi:asparagine synthetase B family protein [Azospirillum sp. Marseille-Q6669]
MCGVAGVLAGPRAEPAGLDELKRMIAMIGHRGPDGYGFYRDGRIGLAHARLSIVGLAGGFQPIHNEERTLWITFNGEIFNHVELRRDLEARGHRFYTRTDTEVIVHAFEEYGPAAWAKLNGQFAIGLWDAVKRELWLVRDRLGILPLFYARSGDHLAFASEAKALFGGGRIEPRFDAARLAQVFTHWSVAPRAASSPGCRACRRPPPSASTPTCACMRPATGSRTWPAIPPCPASRWTRRRTGWRRSCSTPSACGCAPTCRWASTSAAGWTAR